jgi:hypothetical protein
MSTPFASSPSVRAWVLRTWAGWAIGLILVVLLAFVADGIGLSGTQSFVAVGMSLGVSWCQRPLVAPMTTPAGWMRVTVLGLVLPFIAFDVLALAGVGGGFSLPVATTAGGALAGWWQARGLAEWTTPVRWTVASMAGWALGAGAALAADTILSTRILIGLPGLVAYLGLAAAGGLLLGALTFAGFRK